MSSFKCHSESYQASKVGIFLHCALTHGTDLIFDGGVDEDSCVSFCFICLSWLITYFNSCTSTYVKLSLFSFWTIIIAQCSSYIYRWKASHESMFIATIPNQHLHPIVTYIISSWYPPNNVDKHRDCHSFQNHSHRRSISM